MFIMTKRSSTSNPGDSPPLKRQELPSSPQEKPHPALPLEQRKLTKIIDYIKTNMANTRDDVEYLAIYWRVHYTYEKLARHKELVSSEDFLKNLEQQRDSLFTVLQRAVVEDASLADRQAVVSHSVFWSKPSQPTLGPEPPSESVLRESQEKVTQDSWTATFVGTLPLAGLRMHVVEQLRLCAELVDQPIYGHYCSIVQSSGMGKSRLLDEWSKQYFLIPINLRTGARGFPPADHAIRNFLTADNQRLAYQLAASRVRCFLVALFQSVATVLASGSMGDTKTDRIMNFRAFMSKDQTMNATGKDRQVFYEKVIGLASSMMMEDSPDDPSDGTITKALEMLGKALNDGSNHGDHRINTPLKYVDIFVAFDEAHTLMGCYDDRQESRFIVLTRALSALTKTPLFSFFLSTTGKVTQFGQPRGHDASDRINDGYLASPRPYIYVGFDLLARKIRRGMTLDDVTKLDFIAHLGRPLWGTRYDHGTSQIRNSLLDFAIQKLLCATRGHECLTEAQTYAVLSQRLALDINTPQYLLSSASPLHLMHKMHEQVANHMRVCVAVGDGVESLRAVASSEPILSEAASRIMQSSKLFSMPRALITVLSGFGIHQGDRGELLVTSFFTWARDQVVRNTLSVNLNPEQLCHYFSVKSLFSQLFSESTFHSMLDDRPSLYHSEDARLPFRDVFGRAYMHFNHFIKPQVWSLMARKYLSLYMARGAAALGANCQPGFDAVYPYLYGDTHLDPKKVGFIIVEVENDPHPTRPTADNVWAKMDPFKCGLLNDSDRVDGIFPIPIIRIIFSLSTKEEPSVKLKLHETTSGNNLATFTSYDYVCRGISEDILKPVGESPTTWASLVNKPDQWTEFYDVPEPNVLRSQLPGCGTDDGHWTSWVEQEFISQ